MQLLKLATAANMMRFASAKKGSEINLQLTMPIRNGGFRAIDRAVIERYAKPKIEAAKECYHMGKPLIRSVQAFWKAIQEDPILKMSMYGGIDAIPKGGVLHLHHPLVVMHMLSNICTTAPKFEDADITGVPIYALFFDLLDTRFGQALFLNPITNYHLKNIFNDYHIMLTSKVSLKYMNTGQDGWFSSQAMNYWNPDEYYVDKSKPNWGFANWNDWFTRAVRPECRPIAPGNNVVVNSSDSFPLQYRDNQIGRNPATNVKAENKFWLKDNLYSLYDMFGAEEMGIKDLVDEHFVGGTVYQAFLDPWCYHRWHAPIAGTVVKSYKLEGTYYLSNPSLPLATGNPDVENYIDSQPMLSVVSVRQVYIIRLEDGTNRHVSVIEIGMAEVSSCNSNVIEGQTVEKGEQLGFFAFGGSSHVVIFDKNMTVDFEPKILNPPTEDYKVLVNSKLASFT